MASKSKDGSSKSKDGSSKSGTTDASSSAAVSAPKTDDTSSNVARDGIPEISQTLPIPKDIVGYIVGKGGSTIKGIMKGSSTKIFIQENARDPEWNYAHIQGTARAVNRAKKIMINALIRSVREKRDKK